ALSADAEQPGFILTSVGQLAPIAFLTIEPLSGRHRVLRYPCRGRSWKLKSIKPAASPPRPEAPQGPARGFAPREQPAPGQPAIAQVRPERVVVEDAGIGRRDRHHVLGINDQPGGTHDLGTGRPVGADDGQPQAMASSSGRPKPSKREG